MTGQYMIYHLSGKCRCRGAGGRTAAAWRSTPAAAVLAAMTVAIQGVGAAGRQIVQPASRSLDQVTFRAQALRKWLCRPHILDGGVPGGNQTIRAGKGKNAVSATRTHYEIIDVIEGIADDSAPTRSAGQAGASGVSVSAEASRRGRDGPVERKITMGRPWP